MATAMLPPGTTIVAQTPTSSLVNGAVTSGYKVTVKTIYGDVLNVFIPSSVYRDTAAVVAELTEEVNAANAIREATGSGS